MRKPIAIRSIVLTLISATTVLLLAGCGSGGSSSSAGGGASFSNGSISGTVNNGVAAYQVNTPARTLARVLDMVIASSHAGVGGIVVKLTGPMVSMETVTDASGHFRFDGLSGGDYTIEVGGNSTPVSVDDDTHVELELSVNGQVLEQKVGRRNSGGSSSISGEVEDEDSDDNGSRDNSEDEDSDDDEDSHEDSEDSDEDSDDDEDSDEDEDSDDEDSDDDSDDDDDDAKVS